VFFLIKYLVQLKLKFGACNILFGVPINPFIIYLIRFHKCTIFIMYQSVTYFCSQPSGCLQYTTGLSGRFTTFNFAGSSSAYQHLASQNYRYCVRQALGELRFTENQEWPCHIILWILSIIFYIILFSLRISNVVFMLIFLYLKYLNLTII